MEVGILVYGDIKIKEAIAVNEKLTSVNQHQTCLLNAYKNELTKVKQELVSVKIRLDCEPQDTAKQHGESEHHIKTLQAQLKVREESLEGLRKDMVCSSEQNEKCTNALRDAHCLIQRHQDRNCEITKGAEITRQEMKAQQNKLDQLKQDYDEQARQMEINTQSHLVAVQDWQKQEAEISSRLEILQQEVSRLTTTCTELEQLNSTWANQNVALTTQITDLKKKYENEKADMESQASVTVETQDTQTEEGVDWESEASALQQQLDSANRERQLLDSELQEMKRRLDQVKKNKVSMASQTEILQKSTGTLCQLPEECTSSNSSEVKLASSITCKENSSHSNIITSSKSSGSFVPSTTACCTPLHGLSVSCSSASAQSILSSESERNSTLPVSVCSEESWERNGQNISSHSAKSVDFHVAERFKSPGMEMQCQNQTSCSCSSVEANHQSSCPANSEKDDTNETGPARGLGSVNSLESPPLHLKTTTESLKLESCGSAEYENMEKYADSRVQWNDNGKCDLIEMSEDKQKSSFGKPLELLHDKQSARGDEVIAPPPSKRLCMQFNPSPVPMTTDEVKGQLDSSGAKQWLVKCEDEQNQNESESLHHDEAKHRFTNILHDQNQIAEKPMTSLLKMPQGQSSTKQKKKVTFSDESCKENVQIDKEDKRMIAMNVTKEAVNAAISGEESLFSDDEDTSPFEIQSRVARIESYLRADRLRVLKKDDKT